MSLCSQYVYQYYKMYSTYIYHLYLPFWQKHEAIMENELSSCHVVLHVVFMAPHVLCCVRGHVQPMCPATYLMSARERSSGSLWGVSVLFYCENIRQMNRRSCCCRIDTTLLHPVCSTQSIIHDFSECAWKWTEYNRTVRGCPERKREIQGV